ncbi:MAG: oligoendopeptidase F [Clostridia bacterium]|nr:oligoendopeptidase F [Clostridia bacterium]
MKRSEIDKKYKWRLEDIFATDEEWEKRFEAVKARLSEFAAFKGKLAQKDELLACLKLDDEISMEIETLFVYARMRKDEESAEKYVAMCNRIENMISEMSAACSFISPEISKIPAKILLDFAEMPEFSDYDRLLKETVRTKKHILSEKEERLLAMTGKPLDGFQNIFMTFNNVDIDFPTINVEGEKVKLTHGKYSFLLQNKNPKVRKAAYEGVYNTYIKNINTIAAMYSSSVMADNFYAQARGYKSCLDKALYIDDVPSAVYKNLIKSVNKHCKSVHKYVALRKKMLGLRTMHMYDMYLPIVENAEISVPYEQAYDMVLEGLKPLGEEYRNLLLKARDEGWIDVMENEGKRSGAYSWGCYTSNPYVLLNYSYTTHDIFTLAHELGHSMHSYMSHKNQPYAKGSYRIFVAEVASTVNEVLLLKSLVKTEKDPAVKKFLLSYYLDMIRTTLFRQAMFAEFEQNTHDMEQNGQPLTVKAMSDMYLDLNRKYYGKSVMHDDFIKYEWARIPHFYNAFYVYKYATGITSAINIVNDILTTGNTDNYFKFLSAGGSDSPYNILKIAGVDLATSRPYDVAMKEFADTLEQLKKLLEEK